MTYKIFEFDWNKIQIEKEWICEWTNEATFVNKWIGIEKWNEIWFESSWIKIHTWEK